MFEHVAQYLSLGIGGILAGVIFGFYRKDFLKERDTKTQTVDMLLQVVKDDTAAKIKLVDALDSLKNCMMCDHKNRTCP